MKPPLPSVQPSLPGQQGREYRERLYKAENKNYALHYDHVRSRGSATSCLGAPRNQPQKNPWTTEEVDDNNRSNEQHLLRGHYLFLELTHIGRICFCSYPSFLSLVLSSRSSVRNWRQHNLPGTLRRIATEGKTNRIVVNCWSIRKAARGITRKEFISSYASSPKKVKWSGCGHSRRH